LGDAEKRKKYDQFGAQFESQGAGGGPFGGGFSGADFDLGEMFGDLFRQGRGDGATGSSFGFGGRSGSRRQKGRDLTFSLELEWLDAVRGGLKKIRLSNGTTLEVRIPAGVESGTKIRLKGKGEPGYHGGPSGDLLILAQVKEHPFFRREGSDVHMDLPVTWLEALEGAQIRVPTLAGFVQLKLPVGASSGQKLRLKGKGLVLEGGVGDFFVTIQMVPPQGLSESDKTQLVEILKQYPHDPRTSLWAGHLP
jgi:DnaJ-class molecular chaperone